MEDKTIFINHISDHYDEIVNKFKILCHQRHQRFDEDTFHESILRCHKAIEKKGYLNDKTPYGIESYLIRSYFNLILEINRSCVNSKRDRNYNSDNIGNLYEAWYNSNNADAMEKIKSDLYRDFATLYLILKVEENFDNEHLYLFKLKELVPSMTYKKLSELTKMKAVRQKVVEVKHFLKNNVKKEEINNAFYLMYGELL